MGEGKGNPLGGSAMTQPQPAKADSIEKPDGEHEKRIGAADANWAAWYAEFLVREQTGEEFPQ
jgi:hypothetical protein